MLIKSELLYIIFKEIGKLPSTLKILWQGHIKLSGNTRISGFEINFQIEYVNNWKWTK